MTERARKFIADHEKKIRPLDVAAGLAWWNANISGNDADFKKKEETQNKIDEALASREVFAELKKLKEARDKGEIDDKTVAPRDRSVSISCTSKSRLTPSCSRK